jgi:phosphate/phosphite/phosphonate ABC transporter binding protein
MKKLFLILNLLVLASLVLAACQGSPATEAPEPTEAPAATQAPTATEEMMDDELPDLGGREITIAIENAYIPFNYVLLETGEAQGWDYDFIEEACERLNCTPVWVEFGWDTMITSVGQGQFDMAADGITITEERAQTVDFSDGYVAIEQRLMVLADDDRFEGPDDFAADSAALIGTQIGTTNAAIATELVGEARVTLFDDFGVTVQALLAGDVDGVILDETAGLGYLGANKDQLKLIGRSLSSDELGFIFPKGSDLVEPFNQVIAAMADDGTLAQINTKWFGSEYASYDEIGDGAYASKLGTEEEPIKMLFVPSVSVDALIESGDLIEQFMNDATGLVFEVSVPTSYPATIEEMCASPTDTVAFIPAVGYALANQLCGVQPGLASARFGWNVYWAQYIVQRDSPYQTLEDLEGATWGYGEATSTSGFVVPSVELAAAGITPGNQVETGGHTATVNAVYNGEVDFGTTFFSPPLLPEGTWALGDPPDIPDELVPECAVNEDDRLFCGAYRVLDARTGIRAEAPDVIEKVRILAISSEIPNDTMSFSPEFPEDLKQVIIDALIEYLASDACQVREETICSEDTYNWSAAAPIFDENFDGIRLQMEQLGITLETIGE